MTRNGEIARLPAAIRQELNHRLPDGIEKAGMWRDLRIGLLDLPKTGLFARRLRLEQPKIDPAACCNSARPDSG